MPDKGKIHFRKRCLSDYHWCSRCGAHVRKERLTENPDEVTCMTCRWYIYDFDCRQGPRGTH